MAAGKFQLPIVCAAKTLECVLLVFLPIVTVTDEIYLCGVGGPFTNHPTLIGAMHTEVQISGSEIRKSLLAILGQFCHLVQNGLMTALNGGTEIPEVSIITQDLQHLRFLSLLSLSLGGGSLFFLRHLLGGRFLSGRLGS